MTDVTLTNSAVMEYGYLMNTTEDIETPTAEVQAMADAMGAIIMAKVADREVTAADLTIDPAAHGSALIRRDGKLVGWWVRPTGLAPGTSTAVFAASNRRVGSSRSARPSSPCLDG